MSSIVNGWWSAPDEYLPDVKRKYNANRLYKFFTFQGWTRKAICAMLGNMEVESTINPGLWQGRTIPADPYTTDKGFGLTQWTPANKLITWADANMLPYGEGDTQVSRIQYEMTNGLQWGNDVDISFWDFAHDDTQTLTRLTLAFLWNYERPSDPDIPLRQENALKWYNTVGRLPIWLLFKMTQRRK